MRQLDPAAWRVVSPLFDRALDLEAGERRRFVDEVRASDPATATVLTRLLAAHDELEGSTFLEQPALGAVEPDLTGSTVGAYTLDRMLGAGGMGVVWKAHRSDGRYEGAVAVKLLRLAVLERHTERTFTLEGTLLARLSHPNIARLLDAGVTEAGQPYLVLDYVDGTRIDTFAAAQQLDLRARLGLLLQVADAVAHAHAHLVLHRDLKPSNVLVDAEGRVKLLDFGIGSWLSHEGVEAQGGSRGFTPEFAAPEQVAGGEITTAADVYALGGLTHVLLTGRRPDQPAADGHVARPLARDLDLIVARAMAPDPAARYPSVAALADDLRRFLAHEPVSVRTQAPVYRLGRFVRRNRLATALGSAAALAAIVGATATGMQWQRAEAERDFALRQLSRAEAVNDMNAFLLSDAAPLGQSFTAGTLLARAEELLNRHPVQPPDETTVESMISIGRQYWSQDEDDNARRVLSRGPTSCR